MVRTGVVALALAVALVWIGCTTTEGVRHRPAVARGVNDSIAAAIKREVVEMKRAGIGDDVVINLLRVSGSFFPMYSRDVVELADSGVSDSVINAMILGYQARPRAREYRSSAYVGPYYWGWGYPSWYGWDPFYGVALSMGYYWPSYGYRYAVPYRYSYAPRWGGGYMGGRGGGGRRR